MNNTTIGRFTLADAIYNARTGRMATIWVLDIDSYRKGKNASHDAIDGLKRKGVKTS